MPACFPSYCETIKKTALDPVFFNCHRCHHCVLLATGESTRLKRRPYLFQSAREIKETNSSKYQTSFRSLKREILWRFCHRLSNKLKKVPASKSKAVVENATVWLQSWVCMPSTHSRDYFWWENVFHSHLSLESEGVLSSMKWIFYVLWSEYSVQLIFYLLCIH